ncbi:hypothetical protein RKE29_15780 [Streptomyces sp. B1866]|uniref:hypothetical protein n=1 Tax=Streptomyces sp. B1866 TaxID=3075431 RepID=UPI00288E6611|nr:hypothetical protein [Streptomyces sp. B1866]MDT3398084.1 hypothetical protein [Streptomyces sp. B1866]
MKSAEPRARKPEAALAERTVMTWGPGGIPVPYITPWSEERVTVGTLTVRPDGSGLCYGDETSADRDAHGVL